VRWPRAHFRRNVATAAARCAVSIGGLRKSSIFHPPPSPPMNKMYAGTEGWKKMRTFPQDSRIASRTISLLYSCTARSFMGFWDECIYRRPQAPLHTWAHRHRRSSSSYSDLP
jgi:hypothetical protein